MSQPIPPRRCLVLATALAISALPSVSLSQNVSRASVSSQELQANDGSGYSGISADGRVVVFTSYATNLVRDDTNGFRDVFVRDLASGTTVRVSVDSTGVQGNGDSISFGPPSADGRFIPFYSSASNLVPNDTNGGTTISGNDVFVHDRQTGVTEIVSVNSAGVHGNGEAVFPSISADGRYVAFEGSGTNLVAGDSNAFDDMFVRDRQLGTTERVSLGIGGEPNGHCWYGRISSNGRYVGFSSPASNLVAGDTNAQQDAFVHDRQTGTTQRVSVSSGGVQGNGLSRSPSISADGRYVAFWSDSNNLAPGDTNAAGNTLVKDRQTGAVEIVSMSTSGTLGDGTDSEYPILSADGRYVLFDSGSSTLVAGDENDSVDIFLRDRFLHTTVCLSLRPNGDSTRGGSDGPTVSSDFRYMAFLSDARSYVAGDTNQMTDVFVRDLGLAPESFCHSSLCPCVNGANGHGCGHSASVMGALLSAEGQSSLFSDHLSLVSSNQVPNALSVLLQGSAQVTAVNYGDGLRCVGGSLKRLYAHGVSGTSSAYPDGSEAAIAARSATLGDTIPAGSTRYYQAYFRDASPSYCPPPFGSTWNASNALGILWTP